MEWDIDDKNKITAIYNYNNTNTNILDVYDSLILSGYRNFNRGTGEFNQLIASNFNLSYKFGNYHDKFFTYTSLIYSKNHDFFTANSTIQQNFTQATKILIKDRDMLTGNITIERYLKGL